MSGNSPPDVDLLHQTTYQQTAKERQELYRKRVAIPNAVSKYVPVEGSSRLAINARRTGKTQSLPDSSEMSNQGLVYFTIIFLSLILAVRKTVPRILAILNRRFNPWALTPAKEANLSAKIRAEEEAFSEFLTAFQTGPSGSVDAAELDILSPDAPSLDEVEAPGDSYAAKEFYARAAKLAATQQKLIQEISRASDDAGRHRMLADLRCEISILKNEAGLPELLPVWQVAAALEGLLKQLTVKATNVTPSTLRTVGGGVDLLKDLCMPDLKSDSLAGNPLRLLAVDDDPISRTALSLALKKALNSPDLAEDGESALVLVARQTYDVIFLDVQMPGMDGFELCTRIHETALNRTTPVVFVTGQSDFNARAESTLSGGHDVLGKPFLTFEVTVKALTLALRNRLQQRASGLDPETAVHVSTTPSAVLPVDERVSAGNPAQKPGPVAEKTGSSGFFAGSPQSVRPFVGGARQPMSTPTARPGAESSIPSSEMLSDEIATEFLTRASAHLGPLQDLFQALFQTTDEAARQEMLADVYLRIHSFTPGECLVAAHPAMQMSVALQGLVRKLLENPKNSSASTLVTVAAGVDLLNDLCVSGLRSDLITNPAIRMLVVDDDPVARRAVVLALQTSFKRPESAENGAAALALAREKPFDVIFLDVQMPGMDGFAVCSAIRETILNRDTPVVFVTGHDDFGARTQMSLSGGSDFVVKPLLTSEITVKALTFALRGRLQKLETIQA